MTDRARAAGDLADEAIDGDVECKAHAVSEARMEYTQRMTERQPGRTKWGSLRLAYAVSLVACIASSKAAAQKNVTESRPAPAPAAWVGLIGEYGNDSRLLVSERGGALSVTVQWLQPEALREASANVFDWPHAGLYDGSRVVFTRDARGVASQLSVGGIAFVNRRVGPESGTQLRITPVRPVEELRTAALGAKPPAEPATSRAPDLVELTRLDTTIRLEIRYATANNFLGSRMYTEARAFMQRPAAEALVRVSRQLHARGYGLLVHDAYRPWYVTKIFWDATPADKKWLVANPAGGSKHNRGCAVDLTLYDLATGRTVDMVSTYDESTDRAYAEYPGGTSLQRWHRALLRRAMESEGFTANPQEWWHFDYRDWQQYPIMNIPFERLDMDPHAGR
ncbi:MAG: M15 family metallopeptidase [Gemmatimonadota bacterium]|nr:M15 family metallopeptidase [Gemmatimonadota bacterium]